MINVQKNERIIDIESMNEFLELGVDHPSAPIVLDFYADWCNPCKKLSPYFFACAQQLLSVKKDCFFAKVNVDNNPELTDEFRIQSIPCLVLVKGGKVLYRVEGNQVNQQNVDKLFRLAEQESIS